VLILLGYNLLLLLVLVVGSPYWLLRMATSGKYRAGLAGRLGVVPHALREAVAGREVIWLHAVSVGEVIAASRVVAELRTSLPEYVVVISTTTRTGQQLARERFGAATVFYFPLDFTWVVRRYLRALRPSVLVLAETEFWPVLLDECFRRMIPVAVINARISDRSYPRYLRLRWLWKQLLQGVDDFQAQSELDAERLRAIGAPAHRVRIGGNLKFDVRAAGDNAVTRAMKSATQKDTKIIVAGSTLDGEESMLLAAWPKILQAEPNAVLLLAPRHPERFDAVAKLLSASQVHWRRRSEWLCNNEPVEKISAGSVLLLDSIGELAGCYGLATVAFVGGSLVPAGGHNPLEPAQFGVPVVMGRSLENFRAIAEEMLANDALLLVDESTLAETLTQLLQHPAGAAAIGARARDVFESKAGATVRCVQAILRLVSRRHEWERRLQEAPRA